MVFSFSPAVAEAVVNGVGSSGVYCGLNSWLLGMGMRADALRGISRGFQAGLMWQISVKGCRRSAQHGVKRGGRSRRGFRLIPRRGIVFAVTLYFTTTLYLCALGGRAVCSLAFSYPWLYPIHVPVCLNGGVQFLCCSVGFGCVSGFNCYTRA